MHIIRPKYDVDEGSLKTLPLFYLIGPVLGGGDWQAVMCLLLQKMVGDCYIAEPCRWGEGHFLLGYFTGREKGEDVYPGQLEWEQVYIERALTYNRGCVIAWLAEESERHPRTDGNPYGMDTYGEMGNLRGLLRYDRGIKLVVGADPGFRGLRTMKKNFKHDNGRVDFPFYTSMKETVDAAIKKMGM